MSCQGMIEANPDVSGIGIRVNFYVTILLIAAIPQTPHTHSLLGALYTNAGLAGLGLLITAIIQTAQGQLSLYHAIVVQHILFFLGIGVSASGKYKWSTARIALTYAVTFATSVAYLAWALYMWVNVERFGPQAACNGNIKYVFFFVSVRATVPWLHKLWMASLIIGAFALLVSTLVGLGVHMCLARARDEEALDRIAEAQEEHGERHWTSYIVSFPLLSAIYATVVLELIVHRNRHVVDESQEEQWTFGQVLALVMIITSLNEVVHFFFGLLSRSRKDRAADPEGTCLETVRRNSFSTE
ncbi:hypothetical protein BV25DRAFT_1187017 [Artomyces pyxidatus]|uniref:Uncharacterized protein n=1 Tax=Artomyces pyxidatus TaxID=48021 RepID=A0ACB8SR34_9AGAM|nr:hypothetical protein BV25DRAFT_1187017 [Artomyces pyxidatus]